MAPAFISGRHLTRVLCTTLLPSRGNRAGVSNALALLMPSRVAEKTSIRKLSFREHPFSAAATSADRRKDDSTNKDATDALVPYVHR